MKVYALIGQSGTGKSYKALTVARDKEINYIIDDGLLIGGTRVLAGSSAKREKTKIASVRRAIFRNTEQRESVKRVLEELQPDKLLVLSTSDKMIEEIRNALDLPEISERISIQDVSTDKEIELARKSRREDGKHVIPVPSVEIKKDFSGYFIDTLKIFSKKGKNTDFVEKTIIRPTFSYLGKFEVSKNALAQIIDHCVSKMERMGRILKLKIENKPQGIIINMEISIKLVARIDLMINELQRLVIEEIEYITGLNVLSINVTVRSIVK